MKLLAGKTVLITGGSDGIGSAIATACAGQGANLVLVGRGRQKLSKKENDLLPYGIDVISISIDLYSNGAVHEVAGKIADDRRRIDILVNNAGIGRFIPFADFDQDVLDLHLNLNVRVPYLLTRALLNDLIEAHGNVINIFIKQGDVHLSSAWESARSYKKLNTLPDITRPQVSSVFRIDPKTIKKERYQHENPDHRGQH